MDNALLNTLMLTIASTLGMEYADVVDQTEVVEGHDGVTVKIRLGTHMAGTVLVPSWFQYIPRGTGPVGILAMAAKDAPYTKPSYVCMYEVHELVRWYEQAGIFPLYVVGKHINERGERVVECAVSGGNTETAHQLDLLEASGRLSDDAFEVIEGYGLSISQHDVDSIVLRARAWQECHGRLPKDREVFMAMDAEHVAALKGCISQFGSLYTKLKEEQCINRHDVSGIANAIQFRMFGKSAPVEAVRVFGLQALTEMPPTMPEDAIRWAWTHRNHPDTCMVVKVLNAWRNLSQDVKNKGVAALAAEADLLRYSTFRVRELAIICSSNGVAEYDYQGIESRWMKGVEDRKFSTIPGVEVHVGDYHMYRLADNDPRGVMLGVLTNCCQHPGGAGQSCAWHGVENEDGAFFVLENAKGTIVAQSWAWRNGPVVVFDNVEALSNAYKSTLMEAWVLSAQKLVGQFGITEVRVGMGYDDAGFAGIDHSYCTVAPVALAEHCLREFMYHWTIPVSAPTGCYTDAESQMILAQLDSMSNCARAIQEAASRLRCDAEWQDAIDAETARWNEFMNIEEYDHER